TAGSAWGGPLGLHEEGGGWGHATGAAGQRPAGSAPALPAGGRPGAISGGRAFLAGRGGVMNLILAILWLIGAAALFAYESQPGDQRVRIRGTDLSMGWLLLALALYNFARWFSTRSARAAQRTTWEGRVRRFRERRDEPPDPNFDFTREPP